MGMDERLETPDDYYRRSPTSRAKRSWETTDQCLEFNEDSTVAFANPTKKSRIPRPTNFQGSVIPETANIEEPVTLPPIHPLGFDHTKFIELTTSNSSMLSNNHSPPLVGDFGYSNQQLRNTTWQEQLYTNQHSSNQIPELRQQWTLRSSENWRSLNSVDNTYTNWPAPNSTPSQVPMGKNEWAPWQPSDYRQQDYPNPPNEIATSSTDNCDIFMDDNVIEDPNNMIVSSDGEHALFDDQGSITPTNPPKSPSVSQSITEGKVVKSSEVTEGSLCDSCFGVIIFENFHVQDEFCEEKASKAISLEVHGTIAIIRDATSNKYGGLLDQGASRVVVSLMRDYDVEFSACMKATNRIEVLVYGRFDQGEALGDMLLEQDCFLQQPGMYDVSRAYYNPQCLSDPDKENESLSEYDEVLSDQKKVLNENEKNMVSELLDSATGPTDFRRVSVSDVLITQLKEHQVQALSMMTEKESGNLRDIEFPSIWTENTGTKPSYIRFYNTVTQSYVSRKPRFCFGGLLADEMGLGKTLTTLALVATSSNNENENSGTHMTLIVCPMTTITCWQDQIERHFKKGSLTYQVYHGSAKDDDAAALRKFHVVITTYDTLRTGLPAGLLHSIDWHRVVLDEAHIVRNRTTKIFQAVNTLKAKHRWCLTGTPIQNRLEDLGSLVEFLKVDPFDNPRAFRDTFLNSVDNDKQRRWERLRLLVKSISLRRTKKVLDADLKLPLRRETVQWVNMDDEEKAIYDLVQTYFKSAICPEGSSMKTCQLILRLRQICNHGSYLLPQSLRTWLDEASMFRSTVLPPLQKCEACDTAFDDDESSYRAFQCFHQVCRACLPNDYVPISGTDSVCPLCHGDILRKNEETDVGWRMTSEIESTSYRPSSKIKALLKNLQNDHQTAIASGHPTAKSVVFSTWTSMLDLIGKALSANAFLYQRLDGSMSLAQRRHAVDDFRTNPARTILLASLGSAAVGLDLTMASRVHIMEPGWNPLLEQQAMDRVHRLGQGREVIATRYIVSGSIEEDVRRRQERKMNTIASSLDEPRAHLNEYEGILKVT
ncbi:SNF2 family N-terminal domain-containing protein [Jackrogersella minutella]|nr:SNF2 family N-terminal domain-containing protein [Jackrogersella minutella]